MSFFDLNFYILFAVIFIINYLVKNNLRIYFLLAFSLFFYGANDRKFIPLIMILSIIIYASGILIEKQRDKRLYIIVFIITLFPLIFYKYMDFGISIVNRYLLPETFSLPFLDLIAPLGVSYFTFQAITYIGDVYHGHLSAEKNFGKVCLFLIFFPSITSGPIQKARNLLPQFHQMTVFNYERVKHGLYLLSYGMLQKFLISDNLSLIITPMTANIAQYRGFHIIFFALVYSIYIYVNFNSYSDMAIGFAEILGFEFQQNFKRPYLSQTIQEFWQRWHISLNQWFIEYIYIPMGGSRKGNAKKYRNIMTVFLISGLWHGASLHFIVWGALNGLYQIIGNVTKNWRNMVYDRLCINQKSFSVRLWKRCVVFALISIAWIFFAVPSTTLSVKAVLSAVFPSISTLFDGVIISLLGNIEQVILTMSCVIIFMIIQIYREKYGLFDLFSKQNFIFRYFVYVVTVSIIVFCFCSLSTGYGNGGFIYGNF